MQMTTSMDQYWLLLVEFHPDEPSLIFVRFAIKTVNFTFSFFWVLGQMNGRSIASTACAPLDSLQHCRNCWKTNNRIRLHQVVDSTHLEILLKPGSSGILTSSKISTAWGRRWQPWIRPISRVFATSTMLLSGTFFFPWQSRKKN